MNTSIPLMAKTPDFGNSLARGFQTGRAMGAANFARKNGAALMRGDKAALEGYAQIDPEKAFAMQRKQADFEHKQWQRQTEIDAYAASLSKAERDAEAAKLKQAVAAGMQAQSPEQWDAMVTRFGATDLVGRFDEREAIAGQFLSVADALERFDERNTPADPTKGAPAGHMWAEPGNPGAGVKPLPGYESKPADEYGRYVFEEKRAGRVPLSRIDFHKAKQRQSSVEVGPDGTVRIVEGGRVSGSVPVGQDPQNTATPRDPGKMGKELSKSDVAYLEAERERARAAEDLEGTAIQLETLAPQVGYTGPFGKAYGAVDDVIKVLPGDGGARGAFRSKSMDARLSFTEKTKGAITDREMADFAAAAPGLGQTPEGNAMISQVMRAGAARVQQRAIFMEDWAGRRGTLQGAEAAWDAYMKANPIIENRGGQLVVKQPTSADQYLDYTATVDLTPDSISAMGVEELNMLPVEKMTRDQIEAARARYNQLNGGE